MYVQYTLLSNLRSGYHRQWLLSVCTYNLWQHKCTRNMHLKAYITNVTSGNLEGETCKTTDKSVQKAYFSRSFFSSSFRHTVKPSVCTLGGTPLLQNTLGTASSVLIKGVVLISGIILYTTIQLGPCTGRYPYRVIPLYLLNREQ